MLRYISLALLAWAGGALTAQAQGDVVVSGKIEGIKKGQLVLVAQVGENRVELLA